MPPKIDDNLLQLLKKHKLTKDDVWFMSHAKKYAITHKSMEKIQVREKIQITDLELSFIDLGLGACVVKCTAVKDKLQVITFGECNKKNNHNAYPVAMAEKRSIDRAILKLAGMHGDFYSEDELTLRKEQEDKKDSSGMTIPGDEADNSSSRNKPGTNEATIKPPDSSWLSKNVPFQVAYFSSLIEKTTSLDQIIEIKSCYDKWFSQLKSSDLHEVNLIIEIQKRKISPHSK